MLPARRLSARRPFRDGISGQWPGWRGDTDAEMASVYYSQRPVGGRGQHHGDDCSGWICKRKSGAKPGSYAGWALLHSGLLSGRWHNYDAYWVVPAAAQASLAQVQAQLMPAAQAVQAVSKRMSTSRSRSGRQPAFGGGWNTERSALFEWRSYTAIASGGQALCRHDVQRSSPLAGGNMTGALQTPAMNGEQSPLAGSSQTTLQAAINAAGSNGAVVIPPTYAGTDGFTNSNGVYVKDLRRATAQQQERSVRIRRVCDGATDDTNALQAALNYANANGVTLTIPQGTCKTRSLNWRGSRLAAWGNRCRH